MNRQEAADAFRVLADQMEHYIPGGPLGNMLRHVKVLGGHWPAPLEIPRVVEDLVPGQVPRGFVCPITQDIMKQPALLIAGSVQVPATYDKEAIEQWLQGSRVDPRSRQRLSADAQLVPNMELYRAIEDWVAAAVQGMEGTAAVAAAGGGGGGGVQQDQQQQQREERPDAADVPRYSALIRPQAWVQGGSPAVAGTGGGGMAAVANPAAAAAGGRGAAVSAAGCTAAIAADDSGYEGGYDVASGGSRVLRHAGVPSPGLPRYPAGADTAENIEAAAEELATRGIEGGVGGGQLGSRATSGALGVLGAAWTSAAGAAVEAAEAAVAGAVGTVGTALGGVWSGGGSGGGGGSGVRGGVSSGRAAVARRQRRREGYMGGVDEEVDDGHWNGRGGGGEGGGCSTSSDAGDGGYSNDDDREGRSSGRQRRELSVGKVFQRRRRAGAAVGVAGGGGGAAAARSGGGGGDVGGVGGVLDHGLCLAWIHVSVSVLLGWWSGSHCVWIHLMVCLVVST